MSQRTPPLDSARSIREGEGLDPRALYAYLSPRLGLTETLALKQFPSGFSNLTYLVTSGNREWVLRCPPNGRKVASAHDMAREYGTLRDLAGHFDFAPKAELLCEDESVVGKPFYVMERMKGVILRRRDPSHSGLSAQDFRFVCERLVDIQSELHKLDHRRLKLSANTRPEGYVGRQLEGWSRRYAEARTPNAPRFRFVTDWLAKEMPPESRHVSLIHNDYKLDNVVLSPEENFRIRGVLDWEMATIGDPLMDLGCSLAYWVDRADPWYLRLLRTLPTTAPGALTRRELVDRYAAGTGFDVSRVTWYYVFGLFRLAGIAQQIYWRYYHRQTRDKRFRKLILGVYALDAAAKKAIRRGHV